MHEQVSEAFKLLGFKVRDRVTGFEGICEHVGVDMNGCIMATVRQGMIKDKEGKQQLEPGTGFDVNRLDVVGKKPVMEPIQPREVVAKTPRAFPGPVVTDKPVR